MHSPSFAVLDLETTGFSPADRIIEIGIVLTDHAGNVEKTWQSLIQPDRHFENTSIHGISPSDVATAPTFERVAAEIAQLLNGRIIVAHNAGFDARFLSQAYQRCGIDLGESAQWSLCTMRASRVALPGGPQKLSDCLEAIGAVNCRPHAALADAEATAELLHHLMEHSSALVVPNPLAFSPEDMAQLRRLPAGSTVQRGGGTLTAAGGRWLNALAEKLPKYGDRDVDAYVSALRAAMADGKLCASEINQLIDRASQLGIDRDEALWLHSRFVRQLAVEAWADGVVTADEREAIISAAHQLGVSSRMVETLLADPQVGEAAGRLRLSAGDRVTFTGELELPREDWESRSRAAGLDVGGVCRRSVLLVAANPDSHSGKARRARALNVPIVDEVTFARLLRELTQSASEPTPQITGDSQAAQDTQVVHDPHSAPDTETDSAAGIADRAHEDETTIWQMFPWLGEVIEQTTAPREIDADQITIAWLEGASSRPLYELSPALHARAVPSQVVIKPRSLVAYFAEKDQPLEESVSNLLQVRGVGPRFLHRFIYSLVLAVLDDEAGDDTAKFADAITAGSVATKNSGASHSDVNDPGVHSDVNDPGALQVLNGSSLYDENFSIYADDDTARGAIPQAAQRVMGWASIAGIMPTLPTFAPDSIRAAIAELSEHPQLADPATNTIESALAAVERTLAEDERYAIIFARRFVGNDTLEALGECFGVTRERVRQLQVKVAQLLDTVPTEISEVNNALQYRYLPATPFSQIAADIPALAQVCPETNRSAMRTFDAFTSAWDYAHGWLIRPGLIDEITAAVDQSVDRYGVTSVAEVATAVGIEPQTLLALCRDAECDLGMEVGDKLFTQVGNYGDRAAALLSVLGEPTTTEEIFAAFGVGNIRSLAGALSSDDRIIRLAPETWGLAEWGGAEYTTLAQWIGQRVDGQEDVSLEQLIAGATALGLAENSVRSYCTNGEFVVEDGIVRRGEGAVENTADPDDVNGFYHRGADRELLVTITADHGRGSGTGISRGVAAYKQVPFLGKVAMATRLGRDQVISLNRTGAALSSVRDFVMDLGLSVGERVWFVFGADGSFDIRRATPLQDGIDGWAAVLNRLGLDDRLPDHEPGAVSRDLSDAADAADASDGAASAAFTSATARVDSADSAKLAAAESDIAAVSDTSAGSDMQTSPTNDTALAIINEALGLAPRAALRRTVARFNHRRDEETAQQIIALASSV